MTALEQAIAEVGKDISSVTPEHIAQLLQVQAEVQREHDVQRALAAYQLAVRNWQLNNDQRGYYGLPLLPKPEVPAIVTEYFQQVQNSRPDKLKPKQAYYAGMREGLRRSTSGKPMDQLLAEVSAEEQSVMSS